MKPRVLLTLTSVLSVLFFSFHITDDIVRGFEPGRPENLGAVLIMVAWLCGTLVLAERRSGYVIILLGSILGAGVPVLHFQAAGGVANGKIAQYGGAFVWVWTLLALGVCSLFSLFLSAHGLWELRKGRSRQPVLPSR